MIINWFLLGTQYKQTGKLPALQNANGDCSKQLKDKEEEVSLCIQDSASDININNIYVTFDGYENYGVHATVVNPDPTDKESYTNSKNIKMVWGYQSCPKSICIVTF